MTLAFTPTALITLNKDLKMPQQEFCSNAAPSMFAYPPMTEVKKEVEKKKVSTAVLSVSSKGKKNNKKVTESKDKDTEMDVESKM